MKTTTPLTATKFTPGPWMVNDPIDNGTAHAVCANVGDGVHIVPVAHIEPITAEGCAVKRDDTKQIANANLIAAAPELFEFTDAVRDMCAAFSAGHITSTDLADDVVALMIKKGHAALARAIGDCA